jgi:hypothetical protein
MVPGKTDVMVPSTSIAFSEFIISTVPAAPKISGAAGRDQIYLPTFLRETFAAAPAATGWTRTLFASASFIDGQSTAADFFSVKRSHRSTSFGVIVHGDEREAA